MKHYENIDQTRHLSKKQVAKLAKVHDQHCISIYLPVSDVGDVNQKDHGRLLLKNQLKSLHAGLSHYGLSHTEITDYLEPVYNLLEDENLWRYQPDCLAIFLHDHTMNYFFLPGKFREVSYVSDHFYLKPVLSQFNGHGRFFLLALSLGSVQLYEGNAYQISAIDIEEFLPGKLEDVVGYDFQDKSLQFRTGQAGTVYHGQGIGKDDKLKETEKYFRAVDKGLLKILNGDNVPLILACVDEHYPIYAQVTRYQNLFPKHLSGNADNADLSSLHASAWDLVKGVFDEGRNKARNAFKNLSSGEKTSIDLNDIIPAAIEGRVSSLFIQQGKDRFGLYDKTNGTLMVDEKPGLMQASLYNLAAVHTWLNNGRVFIETSGDMPFAGSEINALFRY
jgi:hypothetical protein